MAERIGAGESGDYRSAVLFEGPGQLQLSLEPDAWAPKRARRALDDVGADLDPDVRERGAVIVSELVTNSLKHASLSGSQRIEVNISVRPELMRMDVTDPGDGFEPVALRPGDDEGGAGGWGLWLIDKMADRWGVDFRHSTHVWCEFDRP